MLRQCLACHKELIGQQRKWCCNRCSSRGYHNLEIGLTVDSRSWVDVASCLNCGVSISDRPRKYCSKKCRGDYRHAKARRLRHVVRRYKGLDVKGDVIPCGNPQCFNAAISRGTSKRDYCSKACKTYWNLNSDWLGDGPSCRIKHTNFLCRVYFRACPDCDQIVTMRIGNGAAKVCAVCRVARNQAINARKAHAKRASGPPVLSVHQIAKRDGTKCHICRRKVDMRLSGNAKWGPTIEHVLPVSKGGTNEAHNLVLAHRVCNVVRGNRGHSQLTLVA